MINRFLVKIIVIFIIFEVVSNQSTERFDPPKIFYDKAGKRISAPEQFADLSSVQLENVGARSIITNVVQKIKGIISGGICLTKCILGYNNDCGNSLNCSWKCVAPPEESPPESPVIDKQNDDDIEWSTPDTGGPKPEDLTPTDIVFFYICLIKCLTKYLPFNKPRLQQFVICLSFKCFCKNKIN